MKYTSRDVQSNMQNLIDDVKSQTHLWKPGSEADPGIVLLKALAANVDLLSFNLDTQVDEMYMQSATQIKSIRRLGVANGYQPSWYRAPRTMLTIHNLSDDQVTLDFSMPAAENNGCSAVKNALENLNSVPYFIIPKNGLYSSDVPTLQPAGSSDYLGPTDQIKRVAAQGILKSNIVNPAMMNPTGRQIDSLTYRLPAQNVDSELIWVEEVSSSLGKTDIEWNYAGNSGFMDTSTTDPLYQVTVDDYNNLIILFNSQINNTIQRKDLIRIYYLETYGVAGEITENTLVLSSVVESTRSLLTVTHPGNTMDMPDGSALSGKSPMTAHEAALDALNWVNTNDSIITLKNFNAWIRRQPGISAGISVDCQKALELNWSIRYDPNLDDEAKAKKYIQPGSSDLAAGDFPINVDSNGRSWDPLVDSDLDFPHAFLVYKLMFFTVFNNFLSTWSDGETSHTVAEWAASSISADAPYRRYRPSKYVQDMLKENYRPTYNLTCSIDFGYVRVFEWKVNGVIYTKQPVSQAEATELASLAVEALRIRFDSANMEFGKIPRMMDVVTCVQECDRRIQYLDAGLLNKPMIEWCPVRDSASRISDSSLICDPAYFNAISFARFIDGDTEHIPVDSPMSVIYVSPECIQSEVRP